MNAIACLQQLRATSKDCKKRHTVSVGAQLINHPVTLNSLEVSAIGSRAIEVPVRIENQAAHRCTSVAPASEDVNHRLSPAPSAARRRTKPEHYPTTGTGSASYRLISTDECRPIKISARVENQSAISGPASVGTACEVVQNRLGPASGSANRWTELKNNSATWPAAVASS